MNALTKNHLLRLGYFVASLLLLLPASFTFFLFAIFRIYSSHSLPAYLTSIALISGIFIFLVGAWHLFFLLLRHPIQTLPSHLQRLLFAYAVLSPSVFLFCFLTENASPLLAFYLSIPALFILLCYLYVLLETALFEKIGAVNTNNSSKKISRLRFHCGLVYLAGIIGFVLISGNITLHFYGIETAASLLLPYRISNYLFLFLLCFPALLLLSPLLFHKVSANPSAVFSWEYFSKKPFIPGFIFFTLFLYLLPLLQAPAEKTSHYKLYQSFPLAYVGKSWHGSEQIKQYFDSQRSITRQTLNQPLQENGVRLGFAGDLMRMPINQESSVSREVLTYLTELDVFSANLETLMSDSYRIPPKSFFRMNSHPAIVENLIDKNNETPLMLLSLANNHVMDYPDVAIKDTLHVLKENGIFYHGIDNENDYQDFVVLDVNGLRIGYYAASSFVNHRRHLANSQFRMTPLLETRLLPMKLQHSKTLDEMDLTTVYAALDKMQTANVDLKIISLHWGREHVMYPDAIQIEIAHALVRAGADVIVGSHPHVIQPIEICFVNDYENRVALELNKTQQEHLCRLQDDKEIARKAVIFYSLGNLRAYSYSFWQQLGLIAELSVLKNDTHIDWQLANLLLTYDEQLSHLNSERHLHKMDSYLLSAKQKHSREPFTVKRKKYFVEQMQQHLLGERFSHYEEAKLVFLSVIDSIQSYISSLSEK